MNNSQKKRQSAIQLVMWRLSILIYIPLTLLMMVTIMPIRWLINGKYRFKKKEFPLFYKWAEHIGF